MLLERKACTLTLLGNEQTIRQKINQLGLKLDGVQIIDPTTSELRERFAKRYIELRSPKKAPTFEAALDVMNDVSYFGTMMVQEGLADGMVSGSTHTTAHTLRPALEFVKTRDGVKIASSIFFMCLPDKVLVYGDCAVNPNPTAEELADIAVASAETAPAFQIEPLRGHALLLDRRLGQGLGRRQGARGHPAGQGDASRTCRSKGPSSTTPPSTPRWPRPSCPAARSRARRRSSSSPTSTPATSPTRRCSARPTPSRSARSCRGCKQAGQRPQPRLHRRRHRQHGHHHRHPGPEELAVMSMKILVINSGSSSIKFELYPDAREARARPRGCCSASARASSELKFKIGTVEDTISEAGQGPRRGAARSSWRS